MTTGGTLNTGGLAPTGGALATGGVPVRSSLPNNQTLSTCETPAPAIQTQRIEAECAFGATSGNCKGTVGGQQGTKLENGDADVGYIEGGDYLYYESVLLTGITT